MLPQSAHNFLVKLVSEENYVSSTRQNSTWRNTVLPRGSFASDGIIAGVMQPAMEIVLVGVLCLTTSLSACLVVMCSGSSRAFCGGVFVVKTFVGSLVEPIVLCHVVWLVPQGQSVSRDRVSVSCFLMCLPFIAVFLFVLRSAPKG